MQIKINPKILRLFVRIPFHCSLCCQTPCVEHTFFANHPVQHTFFYLAYFSALASKSFGPKSLLLRQWVGSGSIKKKVLLLKKCFDERYAYGRNTDRQCFFLLRTLSAKNRSVIFFFSLRWVKTAKFISDIIQEENKK